MVLFCFLLFIEETPKELYFFSVQPNTQLNTINSLKPTVMIGRVNTELLYFISSLWSSSKKAKTSNVETELPMVMVERLLAQ